MSDTPQREEPRSILQSFLQTITERMSGPEPQTEEPSPQQAIHGDCRDFYTRAPIRCYGDPRDIYLA